MADNCDDDDDVVADSLSVRQDEPRRGKRTLHELGAGQQPHTHTHTGAHPGCAGSADDDGRKKKKNNNNN